jgi:HSP20 family protein
MNEIIRYKNTTDRFNRLFNNFFSDLPAGMSLHSLPSYDVVDPTMTQGYPSANTFKTDEGYMVEVALPGVNKNNIDINVEGSALIISSNTRGKSEKDEVAYTTREFAYSAFERSFRLPRNVSGNDISAAYHDGILTVTVPTTIGDAGRRISID